MTFRFVFRFVRPKQNTEHFVLCAFCGAQNESSTPGFVSFCAPPKGAHTKRNEPESGVRGERVRKPPQTQSRGIQRDGQIPALAKKLPTLAQVAFSATSWLPGRPRSRSPVIGQIYEFEKPADCGLAVEISFCVLRCVSFGAHKTKSNAIREQENAGRKMPDMATWAIGAPERTVPPPSEKNSDPRRERSPVTAHVLSPVRFFQMSNLSEYFGFVLDTQLFFRR